MKVLTRLGLYGVALATVFGVAFVTAGAVVPEGAAQSGAHEATDDDHAGHTADASPLGLGLEQDGYQLTSMSAPTETDAEGDLSLVVTDPDGDPVTDFVPEHEKELHLITVRADGQHFDHVHPEMDSDGTWSIPWEWSAAGTYRVFADFVPADTEEGITLSNSMQVAGDYDPTPAEPVTETSVDGFEVGVEGDLVAGEASEITMTVNRDGEPVTALEPYLGAFGHLVALRDGDLAYLHAHPHGEAPQDGDTSGPEIAFEITAPTPGRYLLYLDFQVDGQVHTAPLVLDTTGSSDAGGSGDETSE